MKKKIICTILVLTQLFLVSAISFAADNSKSLKPSTESKQIQYGTLTADTGIINADGVRVRSTPSLSGSVKGLLYKGDEVEVGDTPYYADGYKWYWVSSYRTGISGYVVSTYVTIR